MKNRKIKFRGWCNTEKKMYYYPSMQTIGQNKILIFEEPPHNYIDDSDYNDDVNIMQYVGIEDKNGKEIYENDVMKIQLPTGGFWGDVKKEKTGVVRYEADFGGFIVEWEYSKDQHHVLLTCDIAFYSEIIGNTNENPELLKK